MGRTGFESVGGQPGRDSGTERPVGVSWRRPCGSIRGSIRSLAAKPVHEVITKESRSAIGWGIARAITEIIGG